MSFEAQTSVRVDVSCPWLRSTAGFVGIFNAPEAADPTEWGHDIR